MLIIIGAVATFVWAAPGHPGHVTRDAGLVVALGLLAALAIAPHVVALWKRHPVPLEEAAIRAIANNSMALDIYAWLAYRLHSLLKPTPISWRAVAQQFGAGFNRRDNFKPTFTRSSSSSSIPLPRLRNSSSMRSSVS